MGLFQAIGTGVGAIFGGPQGAMIGNGLGAQIDGSKKSGMKQWEADLANANLQREFAQNSISWRVEDAKRNNIHPLAALGVQPFNASATFMPGNRPDLPALGQNIGRSIQASMDRNQRAQVSALDQLTLEKSALENDLLRAQITKINQTNNPPFPTADNARSSVIAGQSSGVNIVPNDLTATDKPHKDAGTLNSYSYMQNPDKSYTVLPAKESKQLMEDFGPASWVSWARTSIKPPPPPKPAPKGSRWFFNPLTQTYSLRRSSPWWTKGGRLW